MPRTLNPPPSHNGAAIRDFRIKAGLSMSELSREARVSYTHLDNIEKQRVKASVEALSRIATALSVRLNSILREPLYANEEVAA